MTATRPEPSIVLASASPRRRELLAQIGLECVIRPVDLDETRRLHETAAQYMLRLAREKARAARRAWPAGNGQAVFIGADTCVRRGERVYGKPLDAAHVRAMLAELAGGEHEVLSAVCVIRGAVEKTALSRSRVRLRALGAETIAAYVAGGEPMDKAGGYAIQGRGAIFVARLEGSYSGVMGLPVYETAALLGEVGVVLFPGMEPA